MSFVRASLFATSLVCFFACGGTTNVAGPTPAPQPTAETVVIPHDPPAIPPDEDATAPVDPHTIYPASHPPIPDMHFGGGRVLASPHMVTVTFAGMDTALRDYLRDFSQKILTTDWWTRSMDGYGVGPGTGEKSVELHDSFSDKTTTDADLKTWIADQITLGKLPFPSGQTVYMLYMPSKATIDLDGTQSCQGFGGYHNSGEVTTEAGYSRFVYAVMNECYAQFQGATAQDIMDEETEVASHEITEAATDPDINVPGLKSGYYLTGNDAWAPDQRGGEVGDLCAGRAFKQGAWSVTQVWNMKSARASHSPCVPELNPVFFSAAPFTEVPGSKLGGAPTSAGYIVVKKGETRKVEVDVFSTGPTGDIAVVVGKSAYVGGQAFDPYRVKDVAKGVTMSLSSGKARNGDKLTLTIVVDPVAPSTTTRFTVRALLSKDDYHSWPVILYVP